MNHLTGTPTTSSESTYVILSLISQFATVKVNPLSLLSLWSRLSVPTPSPKRLAKMLPLTMLPSLATTEKVKPALPALVSEESELHS